jgi:hypothetical protein
MHMPPNFQLLKVFILPLNISLRFNIFKSRQAEMRIIQGCVLLTMYAMFKPYTVCTKNEILDMITNVWGNHSNCTNMRLPKCNRVPPVVLGNSPERT